MAFLSGVGVYTRHKRLYPLQAGLADVVLVGNLFEHAEGDVRMELAEGEVLDTALPVQIPRIPVSAYCLLFQTEGRQIILLYVDAKDWIWSSSTHETVVNRLHEILENWQEVSFEGVLLNTCELFPSLFRSESPVSRPEPRRKTVHTTSRLSVSAGLLDSGAELPLR